MACPCRFAISMTTKFALLLCVILMPVADRAYAAVSDPAAIQVQTLTASLLKSMQAPEHAGRTARVASVPIRDWTETQLTFVVTRSHQDSL